MYAEGQALFEEELMGCLDEDPGSVACIIFTAASAAMFHVLEDRQRVGDDLMASVAFDVRNEAYPTSVMLEFGAI